MWWRAKLWYLKHVLGDDAGIGVVEMILILVVLIALVVIFQDQLTRLVNATFQRITSEASGIG